jgi:16S rRNA (cytidine1402-2'-O)-methyltransferase
MEDMIIAFGDRYAVLSREMTKAYEEFLRGPLSELVAELRNRQAVKGEITLLVAGGKPEQTVCFEDIRHQVEIALKTGKTGVLPLAKEFSKSSGLSKNELYEKIQKLKRQIECTPDGKKGENTNGQT